MAKAKAKDDLHKVKEKAQKAREIAGVVFNEFRDIAKAFHEEQKKVNGAFLKNLAHLYEGTLEKIEAELKPHATGTAAKSRKKSKTTKKK